MEEQKIKYNIHLWAYYPDNETEGFKKGDYMGGISKRTYAKDLEDAKEQAKMLWKKWTKDFAGTQIEVWIHKADVYPPRVGKGGAEFYSSNFAAFKTGSKREQGTPF